MSLQVNLSSKEIFNAYQDVLNDRGINWVILTYEGGTNDLKLQATGNGGLEELEEEFSDGRYVHYHSSTGECYLTSKSGFSTRLRELPTPTCYSFSAVVDGDTDGLRVPEPTPKVCPDQLVRRGRPRRKKGSFRQPFWRSRSIPTWHACCHYSTQRSKSFCQASSLQL